MQLAASHDKETVDMKRFSSRVLLLVCATLLLLGMPLQVFVAEENEQSDVHAYTKLAAPTYTIIIPPDLYVPYADVTDTTLQLTATNVSLEPGKQVSVRVNGTGAAGAFQLFNGTASLDYELRISPAPLVPGDVVAIFTANGTSPFDLRIPDWTNAIPGPYLGHMVFSISYHDSP